MCDRCSLIAVLQQKHKASREKLVAKRAERSIQETRKRRWAQVQKYIPLAIVFILAGLILILFQRGYLPKNQEVNLFDHPDAMLIIIDQAIQDYASAYEGVVPEHLVDLLGKYLPAKKVRKIHLSKFLYTKSAPGSYTLMMKQVSDNPASGMILSETGFEFRGEE